MPTVEEHYENMVDALIETCARPCYQCDGTMRRMVYGTARAECPVCSVRVPSDGCPTCEGTREVEIPTERVEPCDCDQGVVRAERTDLNICANLLLCAVGEMNGARERGDFGTMNRVLDWARRYSMEVGAVGLRALQDNPEELEKVKGFVEKITNPPEPKQKVTLTGGALTDDELRALGLEEGGE